jgi:DNA-binding CsgD family transcriptional regulator
MSQGQIDAARVSIQNALNEAKKTSIRTRLLPAYIEIMLTAGYTKEVKSAADELSGIAEKLNSTFIHALSAHSRGSILLAEGDACSALNVLHQAYAMWNKIDAPYEAARVRFLTGIAYRKEGDEESAEMELKAAQSIFQGLKAIPDLTKVNALIKNKSGHNLQRLTRRELQVMRLVAAGDTNKSIATKLFISERTVERHISNIFNKLRVSSRTAATSYVLKLELL